MRYRLRTLLIVVALGPPLIAVAWWVAEATIAAHRKPAVTLPATEGFEMGGCKFIW